MHMRENANAILIISFPRGMPHFLVHLWELRTHCQHRFSSSSCNTVTNKQGKQHAKKKKLDVLFAEYSTNTIIHDPRFFYHYYSRTYVSFFFHSNHVMSVNALSTLVNNFITLNRWTTEKSSFIQSPPNLSYLVPNLTKYREENREEWLFVFFVPSRFIAVSL